MATAYFSMEFGLHEDFPIYAGGLGILAGDFVKSAHDTGLPVVGIGLRWARGYSRQRIGADGVPIDEVPEYAAAFLDDTGVRLRVRLGTRAGEGAVAPVGPPGGVGHRPPLSPGAGRARGRMDHPSPVRADPRAARGAGDPPRRGRRTRAHQARARHRPVSLQRG